MMEELIKQIGDAPLSIAILVAWIGWLIKQNEQKQARIDECYQRFERHLENHEQID